MTSLTRPTLDSVLAHFVLQHMPEPTLVLDRDGTIVETNRAMAELRDRELSALLRSPLASPIMAGFLAELRANGHAVRELPLSGAEESEPLALHEWTEPARRARVVGVSIDEHMVVTLESAESALEVASELRQCRRVQTLGLMTARIVHDLNNLLTPILIFSRDLSETSTLEGEARVLVRDLESAAQRAAALVKDILDFSRPRASEAETVSLNSVILALRPMLNLALGNKVTLRISLDERATHVRIERGRLEQTLLNLVNNAVSAMPHGGELRVTTANVNVSAQHGEDGGTTAYVVLVLSDTGIGMTDEVRARAFDDFFTTRSARGGTGLGLSSVRQFVRDSKGLIQIESEVGRGTSVIIHLPRAERDMGRVPARSGPSRSQRSN
jgi:signal transduction histidine kinase